MAITKTQSVTGTGSTIVLNSVASGACLVLTSSAFNSASVTAETVPTDSAGTFLTQDRLAAALSTQGVLCSVFYEPNAAAGTHTATPQNFGAGSQQRCFTEFAGIATVAPLDVKNSAKTENTNHTSQATGTTGTTAQARELVVIACTLAGTPGSTAVGWTDPVSGFTTLMKASNDSTDIAGFHAFQVIAAIGTQAATFNWTDASASQTSQALIGTYEGGAPAVRSLDGGHRPKPFAPGSPR